MDLPTPDAARALSALLTDKYPADSEGDEKLTGLLREAAGLVTSVTAREVGLGALGQETAFGCTVEAVPTWLESLAARSVVFRAEALDALVAETAREIAVDPSPPLKSFSAGRYSETYFDPGQVASAKALDPDPAAHVLLWALATPCARNYWLFQWSGTAQPAATAADAPGLMRRPWLRY